MMKVALTIQNGNEAGRVLWVRLDQVIEVGSSDSVDFPVTGDSDMAPLHFEIRHHRYGCFVEAFGDSIVFRINDRDILRKRLHDGDVLVAGRTTFITRIEGEQDNGEMEARKLPSQIDTVSAEDLEVEVTNAIDSEPEQEAPPSPIVETDVTAESPEDNLAYDGQELAAGVWLYQPEAPGTFALEQVVESISDSLECYGVADRGIAAEGEVHDIDANRVLIGPCQRDALVELMTANDSTIAIVSESASEEIALSIRVEPFSFGQPSVFSTQVSMGTNSMVEKLMKNKVAVLVSDPQIGWQLFSTWNLSDDYSKFGFSSGPRRVD